MSDTTQMLATLGAQAEAQGARRGTLRAMVEEASEAGAARALARLGLEDAKARRDMDELRDLLQAWREAKKSAGAAVVSWLVRILLALVVLGLMMRTGWLERIT